MGNTSKIFETYNAFPSELKSIATQCCLMQGLYNVNDISPNKLTLRQFIFRKHQIVLQRLSEHFYLSQGGKKILIQDRETLLTRERSGYWHQRLLGRPVTNQVRFEQLYRLAGWNSSLCIHPLFRLLSNASLLQSSPSMLTNPLSESAREILFKDTEINSYEFDDIPTVWKQSYKQVRKNLVQKMTLDAFFVCLLQTIYQHYFLNKQGDHTFLALLWEHFEYVFCYKYPVTNISELIDSVSSVLNHYSNIASGNIVKIGNEQYERFKNELAEKQHREYPTLNGVVFTSTRSQRVVQTYKRNNICNQLH